MKTNNRLSLFFSTVIVILFFFSCHEWGEWDPPSGNQVYPTLQLLSESKFESLEEVNFDLIAYDGGEVPEIVKDETLGNVLHLDGGYIRFNNPLYDKKIQSGASLTCWVKLAEADEEGALFSFANEDNTSSLVFAGNGRLSFRSPEGSVEVEKVSSSEKSMLTADEWHYLAIAFTTTGYSLNVDGENIRTYQSEGFDFTTIRDFFMEASYLFVGHGSSSLLKEAWFDDLKVYRNTITSKEISVPKVTPPGDDFEYQFPPLNTVGYYLLDNSFTNLINPAQGGEFITVETQANPSGFKEDPMRGTVWNQQEGWTGHENGWAYTRFDNPMKGAQLTDDGLTLTMWINPPTINWWDQIFVLNDGTSKFWINALGYVGYNGTGGYFDCHNNNNTHEMKAGEWTMFTLVMTTDEFTVYYNDEVKFTNTNNGAYAGDLQGYQNVLDMFTSAANFYFGYESWWKAAPAMIDDLLLISRPVSEKEVKLIYQDTKRVNGGNVENPSYIPSTAIGYYKLDDTFTNEKNPAQGGEFVTVEAQANPSGFKEDPVRGTVWNQQEGWTGHENGWAYTRFDNPMKGAQLTSDGLTLTMWINPPTINWWDQIFVLNDGTSKFWINALGYVGYNGTGGYFDCHNNNNTHEMKAGEWTMFTLVMTTDEFTVYYNDEVKFTNTNNGAYAGDLQGYQNVLDMFTSAANFYFGYESWWKAAPAMIDDVFLCTSPLTEKQVKALYNGTKK